MTDQKSEASDSDIAIVGTAARFPGARNVGELWRVFRDGVEAISHYEADELLAAGVDAAELRDPNYVRASGHLEDVEMFDAGFFGFGPKDAAITDPQHRHFLECCWEALEDSGHPPAGFDGSIGIFAGCGLNAYFIYNLLRNREVLRSTGAFLLRHTGNDRDFLPTTVSYKLDLTGPSVAVQTACSTSLVAIHMGCQSLLSGECDMVLAGGVTVKVPHRHGYLYADNEPLDPTGHCRAFDARGAGTVLSSGSGVVVLRRLAEALEDGDRVHAVIKGSAINNDGSRKIGYLAPSVDGQAAVVAEALAVADVPADSIGYVATHGTGTHVGDPIEVSALTQAYRESTDREQFCFIGSSKPNIGHTDNAAGIASLLEVVEALKHRQIPPSIQFERPNPNIDFERSPFRVSTELRDWTAPEGMPRRGGVSSLGVGGTNAHVILEEAPPRPGSGPAARELEILALSAKSGRALDNTGEKLAAHFREHPDLELADAAHTLQTARAAFEHRRVFVAGSPEEAAVTLEAAEPKRVFTARAPEVAPQIDFMFPGGGAQYPNMGRELYDEEPVYRAAIDECLELAAPHLPVDLRALMMPDEVTEEGSAALAMPTACVPAIFATEIALARLWLSLGVEPRAMIGHSLGEYAAAHFAGVLSLPDVIRIVCLRGVLVDTIATPGRMLSVPLPEDEVLELIGDEYDLAAANGPSLCTVSGTVEGIEALDARLREREIECRQLRVPAAGHSRILDPILDEFRAGIASVRLSPPEKPYVSNSTGDWVRSEDAVDPDYWVRHLRRTVRWSAGLETLLSEGSHLLLEVGPGQTLGSLARQQPTRPVALSSLRHPDDDVPDLRYLLQSFGRLWTHGAEVSFEALRGAEARNRIALPTYGFDRQPYWIEPDEKPETAGGDAQALERIDDLDRWFFQPRWRPAPELPAPAEPLSWLVFADDSGLSARLVARLLEQGHSVVTVREGDAFYRLSEDEYAVPPEAGLEGYTQLVQGLASEGRLPDRIAHLWLVTRNDPNLWDGSNFFHHVEERGFYSLLHLAQALGAEGVTAPIHMGVVSNGLQRVGSERLAHPEKATAFGPIRVIPQEFPNVTCQCIDVPVAEEPRGRRRRTGAPDLDAFAGWLAADIQPDGADQALAYRDDRRLVQELEAIHGDALPEVESRLRQGGSYLITGGVGGLGLVLAEHLARTRQANLLLLSRSALPPRSEWEAWLETHGSGDPTSEKLRRLIEIEALGSDVMVASADVANVERMREVVGAAQERFGKLHGIFHAAGLIDDAPIQTKSQPEIERVFAPKVHGTLVLDQLVSELEPDLFVLFSSSSCWLGPAGQVDYTGASAFLNALAESRAGRGETFTVAVDWGVWRDVGAAVLTYRRLSGLDRSGPPVAHPLLDRRAGGERARPQGDAFTTELVVDDRWILDEHRTLDGCALIPGTGYLEMVHGAFAELAPGPAEIRGASFVAPLMVDDDESVEVRTTLSPEPGGHAFEIESRIAGGREWRLHAQGRVGPCEAAPAAAMPISEIEARCSRSRDAGGGEGLRTLHEGQLQLGARWRSIRSMRFGEGEAIARLSLPEAFRRDLDDYRLHPALLDMATGFATPLIEGYEGELLFAPMSYERVRIHDRLPAEIVSHVRSAGENAIGRETASFDVTLADLEGRVLLEVEGFTLRKIAPGTRLGGPSGGPAAGDARKAAGDGQTLSEAERVFQQTYELGITPKEGLEALERVLGGGSLPLVCISPIELPTLVSSMRALSEAPAAGAARFARPELETDFVAPRDGVESALAEMWRELLGVEEVGIHDDFFELGGHSLIAVRLFAKVKKLWDIEYPISVLFDAPTIETCAGLVRADAGLELGDEAPAKASHAARFRCLVPLQKAPPQATAGSDRPPFFLVAGMFGNVLNLRHIATHLGADQPMWAIQARGLLGDDAPHESFEEAARDYLEEIRAVQPEGPYYLGGFSGGGITAFEMAKQLCAAGEQVGILVLLDSLPAEMPPLSLRGRLIVQWHKLRAQGPGYPWRWLRNRIRWELERRGRREPGAQRDLSPAEFRSGQIEAAFRRALGRYETGRFDGPITLIRPPQDELIPLGGGRFLLPSREIVDYENCWTGHTEGGVKVEIVPGDHDSMVLEPNVRVLTAKLRSCLDEAMLGKPESASD